jgi:hypothetical protein
MKIKLLFAAACLAALAMPVAGAQAQGVPGGADHGFHEGNRIAGPVGGVVGAAVGGVLGGVVGGVNGVLGIRPQYVDYRAEPVVHPAPRYRHYRHHRRSRHHR